MSEEQHDRRQCDHRFEKIEERIDKLNIVSFNGYGKTIDNMQHQVNKVEAKMNWVFATMVGCLAVLILNLIAKII